MRYVVTALLALLLCLTGAAAQDGGFSAFQAIGLYTNTTNVSKPIVIGYSGGFQVIGESGTVPPPAIVFSQDYSTDALNAAFTTTRLLTGWAFDTSQVIQSFGANLPRRPASPKGTSINGGLGLDLLRVNLYFPSAAPVTKTFSLAGIGTKRVWLTGSGSVAVSGVGTCAPDVDATHPCTFFNAATGNITVTVTGSVTHLQIEQCSTANVANCAASAPIVTTSANVTRNADVIKVADIASLGIPKTAASYVIDYYVAEQNNLNQVILSLSDCTVQTQLRLAYQPSNTFTGFVPFTAGAPGAGVNSAATPLNQINRVAVSYDATGVSIALNGQPTVTRAFANSFVPTCLNLGSDGAGGNQMTGFLKKIVAYGGRLSTSQLQIVSAIPIPTPPGGFKWVGGLGQSLAIGVQALVLTTSPPAPTCALMPNDPFGTKGVQGYNGASVGAITTGYVPAFEFFYAPPPYDPLDKGETQVTTAMVNLCSYGLGETYIGRSNGWGGQPLANLLPSAGYSNYQNMINDITTAVALSGTNVTHVGAYFAQGETDRVLGTTRAFYRGEWTSYAQSINVDVKALTTQVDDIPIYIFQLAKSAGGGGTNDVTLAQYDVALTAGLTSPYAVMCGPQYIYPKAAQGKPTGDGTHDSDLGYMWMGAKFAYCVKRVRAGAAYDTIPLRVSALAFDAVDKSLIKGTFNKAVSVVAPGQGAAANHGFEYLDDCSSVKISTVTFPTATTFELQLTGVPSCANPLVETALLAPAKLSDIALPTLTAGGSGYVDGTCSVSVAFNASNAFALGTLDVTVVGGAITAINSVTYTGLYDKNDNGTHGGVPLTGCSGSGATVTAVMSTGFQSNFWSASWSDLAFATGQTDPVTGFALNDYLVMSSLTPDP